MAKKKLSYKNAVEEIESIVDKIENGEPDVDELAELVKRAAGLIKECKVKLKGTEDSLSETLEELE
ncbi:exodeoxyribonuclease VII small subunit [Fulvivirga sediminis]|uniref:Exodeoxyribonuclease VII small subunit n=1 Tax=Fulvivirga sediminis TaxID=2803949 RepID=A0A937JYR7_9BACT|nr:exodeoxyribonuclease VII small subunit [Fulvivirga sediminis]MBL3655944.1 exodeoxyribonuclease VII small subunit [Fulvivirga sediminis]